MSGRTSAPENLMSQLLGIEEDQFIPEYDENNNKSTKTSSEKEESRKATAETQTTTSEKISSEQSILAGCQTPLVN